MGGSESSSKHTTREPSSAAKAADKTPASRSDRVGIAALTETTRGRSLVPMTVATIRRFPSLRGLASSPRRGLAEVATIAGLYGFYELVRGQGHG